MSFSVPNYLALAEQALTRYDRSRRESVALADADDRSHAQEPLDISAFAQPDERVPLEAVLKGQVIALYSDLVRATLWLVADEEDARLLGERRGAIYTAAEARLVATIDDPEVLKSVHQFKKVFNVAVKPPDEDR